MGILKKITNEYFGDFARGEDTVVFNTSKMIPLDMGGTVLWADRDLEVESGGDYKYDKYFFTGEHLKMKFDDEWRLPSLEEYLELFCRGNGVVRLIEREKPTRNAKIEVVSFTNNNREKLIFDTSGYYVQESFGELFLYGNEQFDRWCSNVERGAFYLIDVSMRDDVIERYKNGETRPTLPLQFERYYPIRLVKDKK